MFSAGILGRTLVALAPKRLAKAASKPVARKSAKFVKVVSGKPVKAPVKAVAKAPVNAKRRMLKAVKVAGARKPAAAPKKNLTPAKKQLVRTQVKTAVVAKRTSAKDVAPAVAVPVAVKTEKSEAKADDCPFGMYVARAFPQLSAKVAAPAEKFAVKNADPVKPAEAQVVVEDAPAVDANAHVHFEPIPSPTSPGATASVTAPTNVATLKAFPSAVAEPTIAASAKTEVAWQASAAN